MTLEGKVALVAGATRGAGRGIAVELGAAGATVYVTGRTTRDQQSDIARPETIEETAELVTAAGGKGIAVPVDHLVPDEVRALVERIRAEQGRLDILVNDIWGGEKLFEWNKPVWDHDLENGLRLLRLGIDTHLITAHYALPLMIERPGGLLVEVTDGTADYNADHYRLSPFYDLAKVAVKRMAWAHAKDLAPHGATAVSITPGWLRSEMMLEAFGVTRGHLARRDREGAALRDLRDAALRRPRRRGAGRRPRPRALERAVAVERRPGAGLWLHRPRRLAARRLALPARGAGGGQAGRRHRLPLARSAPLRHLWPMFARQFPGPRGATGNPDAAVRHLVIGPRRAGAGEWPGAMITSIGRSTPTWRPTSVMTTPTTTPTASKTSTASAVTTGWRQATTTSPTSSTAEMATTSSWKGFRR